MLKVKRTDLEKHTTRVNAVLQEVCEAPSPAPLVHLIDGTIALGTSCRSAGPNALCREVTSDLGPREIALRLPIPDAHDPRFWIAIHEQWEWTSKNRVYFVQCGLRLYIGDRDEEAIQFLRLEWVAPTVHDGIESYQGAHAGHPHWHIDRSTLVGQEDYLRSLELLTAPAPHTETEEFSSAVASAQMRPPFDFSWLQYIHLPARAHWMRSEWDGHQVPGPHQCEPTDLDELTRWWSGALRYFVAELPR
jgi:hypothetical protein